MDLLYSATIIKAPGSKFKYTFDFVDDISSSASIVGKVVTARDATGTDATSTIIVSSTLTTPEVEVLILLPSSDQVYRVTCVGTSNGGEHISKTLLLYCADPTRF